MDDEEDKLMHRKNEGFGDFLERAYRYEAKKNPEKVKKMKEEMEKLVKKIKQETKPLSSFDRARLEYGGISKRSIISHGGDMRKTHGHIR